MEYLNLDITIMNGHFSSPEHANSRGKDYPVTATFTKGEDASAIMQFPFDEQTLKGRLEDVEQSLYNVQAGNRIALPERGGKIHNFGQDLFNALFCGHIRRLYETVKRSLKQKNEEQGLNPENEQRLRIRLHINPPELAVLPWELMYDNDPENPSYLCLDRLISLVRYQELRNPYSPLQVELPLYILGMTAAPKDQGPLDIKAEKEAIKKQLKSLSKSVKLNWLPGSGWEDLRKAMRRSRWHIFHFIGHGNFNVSTNEGFIILVDANGNSVPVNARDLGLLLDHPSLRLVILNSCNGAYGDSADAFSSIATILARRNIPAIIAMQYKITDEASIKFAGAFYGTLTKGEPIDAALFDARLALKGIPFSMEWAIPVLHMRSRDGNLFTLTSEPPAILPVPSDLDKKTTASPALTDIGADRYITVPDESQTLVSSPPQSDKTIQLPPLEPETVGDPLIREPDQPVSPKGLSRLLLSLPPFIYKIPRRVYTPVASIILFMLVFGGIFVLPPLLLKQSPGLFPTLCSGNFQSTNIAAVSTPVTSRSPDGEPIGLSEGTTIFDLQRSNQQEVQYKLQAAQDIVNNPQDVVTSLNNAINSDPTDAEAQIYLENWKVLTSSHPHITLVVGVSFRPSSTGGSRSVLQGAFTAQKTCNDQNSNDTSKTQVVLMIANLGGITSDERANSATFVADQIEDQAHKDPTIAGIMGWPTSTDSINVNYRLKTRGSHIPMVASSSSSDALKGMSNFFCVCPTNNDQAQVAAGFLLNTQQKKKISVLFDSTTSFATTLKDDFVHSAPKANILQPVSYTGNDSKSVQGALTTVLAQQPDAIFFAGQVSDLVELLHDISSTPYANLPIVGGDSLSTTSSYVPPIPDLRNVYFTAFASPNEWDKVNPKPPFFQDYQDYFGKGQAANGLPSIDASVMLGYDATLTLLYGSQQVLSTKNTITPSDLTSSLQKITVTNAVQGVTGRIAFDSKGNQYVNNKNPDHSKVILLEHIAGTSLMVDEIHGCLLKDNCSS